MTEFEPSAVEERERPPAPRGSRLPSRAQIRRRRLAAAAIGAAVIALTVLGIIAGGGGEETVPVSEEVSRLVRGLSAAEKVDVVLAVGFSGKTAADVADAGIGKTQGGVVITQENWPGAAAAASLASEIRAQADPPPLVIGLQEGGEYRSYPDLPPGERQLDIGDRGLPNEAETWARSAGEALKKAGFDLNLAPVADISTLDAPIADRAFGDDSGAASEMTAAAIRGCRAAGIGCAVRHFPGAGAESADTDQGPATVALDEATLLGRDLAPFRAAFTEKAPAVVVSHAFYSAYDAVRPASQTPEILEGLLRDELGFKGVAITDDLAAGAISGGEDPAGAAARSLAAGADLILASDPAAAATARRELLEAIRGREIPPERLDQAASRVLELKRQLGLVRPD